MPGAKGNNTLDSFTPCSAFRTVVLALLADSTLLLSRDVVNLVSWFESRVSRVGQMENRVNVLPVQVMLA